MSTTQKHPNSKQVTLFRAGSFINDAQTQAQDFLSLSKKSIGSYFNSVNEKGIGSGLTFPEIDVLMPLLLDIPKEDRSFREKVREFFTSLLTKVSYGTGVTLEIGLDKDNNAPVSETNLPINVMDFVRYRHAKNHPRVAANRDLAKGNMLFEFYIFDKDAAVASNTQLAGVKDEALVVYLKLKDDEEKVNMMLTLLMTDPRSFAGKNAFDLKQQALRTKADTDANTFMEAYKKDNFELRYSIQAMVNTGILKIIGQQYVDAETGNVIGHTLEEAIYFLKDTTKTQEVGILKARLQEATKALITRKKVEAKAPVKVAEPTTPE